MIVGNGDIAKTLIDKPDVTYFASGVSNSQETDWFKYQREANLLLSQNKYTRLVYFSSLSMYYVDSHYTRHKKRMEELIKRTFPSYTIIRIGNITWGNNPNTLINNIKYSLKENKPFNARDEFRYVVDKDEFLYWVNMIPDFNTEINIVGRRLKVCEIYNLVKSGKL